MVRVRCRCSLICLRGFGNLARCQALVTCPYGGDSQGGTFCFSATWETVLNNVIQQVFSLSSIALYIEINKYYNLGNKEHTWKSENMSRRARKRQQNFEFWFRKTFMDSWALRVLPTSLSHILAHLDHFEDVKP